MNSRINPINVIFCLLCFVAQTSFSSELSKDIQILNEKNKKLCGIFLEMLDNANEGLLESPRVLCQDPLNRVQRAPTHDFSSNMYGYAAVKYSEIYKSQYSIVMLSQLTDVIYAPEAKTRVDLYIVETEKLQELKNLKLSDDDYKIAYNGNQRRINPLAHKNELKKLLGNSVKITTNSESYYYPPIFHDDENTFLASFNFLCGSTPHDHSYYPTTTECAQLLDVQIIQVTPKSSVEICKYRDNKHEKSNEYVVP